MTAQLEHMLLVAILDNSQRLHTEAQEYARSQNLTQNQINHACKKVTSFLRWHGVEKMLPVETLALVKLQAFFRMLLVRRKLFTKMMYYQLFLIISCFDAN